MLFNYGCKKNEVPNNNTTTPATFSIGQSYKGGIITYILQSGDPGYDANVNHGLITSTIEVSSGAIWGCSGTNISGCLNGLGTGAVNSQHILTACTTSGIAAKVITDVFPLNGYSDWYLPSRDELRTLSLIRPYLPEVNFNNVFYWSSSQVFDDSAWSEYFTPGSVKDSMVSKSTLCKVIAMRSF